MTLSATLLCVTKQITRECGNVLFFFRSNKKSQLDCNQAGNMVMAVIPQIQAKQHEVVFEPHPLIDLRR